MTSVSRQCYMLCRKTGNKITLPDGKLTVLGRNPITAIIDVFVSKAQIECTANVAKCNVKLRVIGRSISGCNGYALSNQHTYTLKNGDIFEFRLGFHPYEIVFDPCPEPEEPPSKKPKLNPRKNFPLFDVETKVEGLMSLDRISGSWEQLENSKLLVYSVENIGNRSWIAGFDLDGTIIKTKSGNRFPRDGDDWVFNFSDIPEKLRRLYESNYKIVFLTNQSGLESDPLRKKEFKRKVENIVNKIGVPVLVLVAVGLSIYRKPMPGMWNYLKEYRNGQIPLDFDKCFYVGDAAGREASSLPKRVKDHSCADRLFALNLGLKFYTPEEYFLKLSPVNYKMPEFDPRTVKFAVKYPELDLTKQNVIVMVGSPGSGKTFFSKHVLLKKGYDYVSRDELGSYDRCVSALEEKLKSGKSVVIDNTNPDRKSRERFIKAAKLLSIECRCCQMTADVKQSKHNNRFRQLLNKKGVNDVVINKFFKDFQEPEAKEGFVQVLKIPFVAKFENEEHEKLYKMFLLES